MSEETEHTCEECIHWKFSAGDDVVGCCDAPAPVWAWCRNCDCHSCGPRRKDSTVATNCAMFTRAKKNG